MLPPATPPSYSAADLRNSLGSTSRLPSSVGNWVSGTHRTHFSLPHIVPSLQQTFMGLLFLLPGPQEHTQAESQGSSFLSRSPSSLSGDQRAPRKPRLTLLCSGRALVSSAFPTWWANHTCAQAAKTLAVQTIFKQTKNTDLPQRIVLKEPVWGIRWTFTIINALRHLFYATQVAPLGTKQEDGARG